jgi:hypothetical protein
LRLEKRTRVEVFIPVREDDLAYEAVSRWIAEEFAFRRGGATATTAFIGLYASPSTGHIMRDHVQIVFTDVLVDDDDADSRDELLAELDLLRTDIERMLAGEEEIWVTTSPIGIVRG